MGKRGRPSGSTKDRQGSRATAQKKLQNSQGIASKNTDNSALSQRDAVPLKDKKSLVVTAKDKNLVNAKTQLSTVSSSQSISNVKGSEGMRDKSDKTTRKSSSINGSDLGTAQTTAERTSLSATRSTSFTNRSQKCPIPTDICSRQKQVRALIDHRRILLDRMRQCRNSAEKRIEITTKQLADATFSDSKGESSDSNKLINAKKSLTEQNKIEDEQEIAAFRELSRQAINAAKKQRAADTDGHEKRGSISLRRGSSVGKRMSAALSTLAPGAAATSGTSSTATETQTLPLHQVNASAASTASQPPGAVSGAVLPPSAASQTSSILIAPQQSSTATTKLATKTSSVYKGPMNSAAHAGAGQTLQSAKGSGNTSGTTGNKKRGSTKNQRKAWNAAAASAPTTSDPYTTMSLPLHAGTGGSSLPINRLAQSSVICPEAIALREKRNAIRTKLASIIHERQKRKAEVDEVGRQSRQKVNRSVSSAYPPAATDLNGLLSFESIMLQHHACSQPTKLPHRRKTHWDYLLEEMKWLATDFIEERKWKNACARTLSSAAVSAGLSAVSPATSKDQSTNLDKKKGDPAVDKMDVEDTKKPTANKSRTEKAESEPEEECKYKDASPADVKASQTTAAIISDMVTELWDVTVESGALPTDDAVHKSAHARHMKLREKLVNKNSKIEKELLNGDVGVRDNSKKKEEQQPKDSKSEEKDSDEAMEVEENKAEELSYNKITERVESLMESFLDSGKGKRSKSDKQLSRQFDGTEIPLTAPQLHAIDFVDKIWTSESTAGAVLDGVVGCGKTIATCSLLWRKRTKGPHLIICAPARLIRWKHELARFDGLRVSVFGLECGISSPVSTNGTMISSYGPGDVIVSDYSSLFNIDESKKEDQQWKLDMTPFHSITLDARFPFSTGGGFSEFVNNSKDLRQTTPDIPPELASRKWWIQFLNSLSSLRTNRLLVECCGFCSKGEESEFGCNSNELGAVQCLETLASKIAFILGPGVFYSGTKPIVKKVLSWTKRRVKEEMKEKMEKNKLEGIKTLLLRMLTQFSHQFEELHLKETKSRGKESRLTWGIRLCELPRRQRIEYDRCCSDVRGALSSSKTSSTCNPYKVAGSALLRLRRVCLHPQVGSVLRRRLNSGNGSLPTQCTSAHMHRNSSQNPSQPDIDLALDILSKSAKMRELIRILRFECGYRFDGEDAVLDAIDESCETSDEDEEVSRAKVAVLATLPEAQLLTSILLNALGLTHELLMTPSQEGSIHHKSKTSAIGTSLHNGATSVARHSSEATTAWINCQLALSKFNTNNGEGSEQFIDLIVTSPVTIGSDHGGLGAASAECLISLDEDWSGRGDILLKSIVASQSAKCGAVKGGSGQDCELIRLACAATCEERFLNAKCPSSLFTQWPIDIRGYFQLPSLSSQEINDIAKSDDSVSSKGKLQNAAFSFPAANIMKFRNEEISTVLCTQQPLHPDFVTGMAMRFLPTSEEGDDTLNISFARSLIHSETSSCPLSSQLDCLRKSRGEENLSLTGFLSIAPPLPALFPPMVMTRSDLVVLPSRVYVQNCGRSLIELSTTPALPGSPLQLQPETISSVGPSEEHVELADSWHKSGLSCKPDDFAASLLVYSSGLKEDAEEEYKNQEAINKKKRSRNAISGSAIDGDQSLQQTEDTNASQELCSTKASEKIGKVTKIQRRSNCYSNGYSKARDGWSTVIQDGNQGYEPLVYFPPLFPGILFNSQRARTDIASVEGTKEHTVVGERSGDTEDALVDTSQVDVITKKRKETNSVVVDPVTSGKRPRIHPPPTASTSSLSIPSSSIGLSQPVTSIVPASSQINAAVGNNYKVNEDSVDTADRKSAIITEDEASNSNSDAFSILIDLNEDFGLAGIGALSLPSDSAKVASSTTTRVAEYSNWKDPFEPDSVSNDICSGVLACDSEEADAAHQNDSSLDSMLLFVTRKGGQGILPGLTSQVQGNFLGTSGMANIVGTSKSSGGIGNGLIGDIKMNGAGTKKKKKFQNQSSVAGQSAFSRLPSMSLPAGQLKNQFLTADALKTKDGYRNKVASLLARRETLGLSLFEFSSFRLAAIRIRKRISDRVSQTSLAASAAAGVGSGLPLITMTNEFPYAVNRQQSVSENDGLSDRWTSIVTKLPSGEGKVGDMAKSTSSAQRASLRRSLVSPCRVDFGPFDSGFLALTAGMTGISPPRSRVGISLPMGVKIPQQQREQHQHLQWTTSEDTKLQDCAVQFGLNWFLAARAVSGLDSVKNLTNPESPHVPSDGPMAIHHRSARQCRERWQSLAKAQPCMANEVRKSERSLKENTVLKPEQIHEFLRDTDLKVPPPTQDTETPVVSLDKTLPSSGDVDNNRSVLFPSSLQAISTKMETGSAAAFQQENSSGGIVPMVVETTEKTATPTTTMSMGEKRRRTFNMLRNSVTKRQDMPITIPGYSGSGKPSLVASHKSHMESVEAAVRAASTRGSRGDMWPLQILDLADKKRGGTTTTTTAAASNNNRQQQQTSNVHRQPSTAVPQPTAPSHQIQRQQALQYQPPPSQIPQQPPPPVAHQLQQPQQPPPTIPSPTRTSAQPRHVPQPPPPQPQPQYQQPPPQQPPPQPVAQQSPPQPPPPQLAVQPPQSQPQSQPQPTPLPPTNAQQAVTNSTGKQQQQQPIAHAAPQQQQPQPVAKS